MENGKWKTLGLGVAALLTFSIFNFQFSISFAQVPAPSTALNCIRDDALSTLSQAEGRQVPCRVDANGAIWFNLATRLDQANDEVRTQLGINVATLSGWTSATGVNATQDIFTSHGTGAVLLHLVQGSTITAGAITFEVSYDGTNWVTIPADAVLDPASTTFAQISLPYTLVASTNKPFLLMGKGWRGLRIKLSTAITGTGTVTPNYALLAYEPAKSVIALSPTAANFQATANAGTNLNTSALLTTTDYNNSFGTAGSPDSQVQTIQGAASMTPVQVSHLNAVQQHVDPCQREAKIRVSINQTAGTQLATGTASERIYICSFHVVSATAQNIALVSGTGTVCATSPSGVEGFGGSTAATGWNLAANGGLTLSAAGHAYGNTDTDADNLCLLQSGAGQVSGGLTYVSAASGL